MISETAPRTEYARQMPDAFVELEEYARTLLTSLPGDHEISPGEVRLLVERVDELDDETLEQCRYYGLGLVICGTMRQLNAPGRREHYVGWSSQWTANDYHKNSKNRNGGERDPNLRIGDFTPGKLSGYLEAGAALGSMDQPRAILTETLMFVALKRMGFFDEAIEGAKDKPSLLESYEESAIENIIDGKYSRESVSNNLVAGTLIIMHAALVAKRMKQERDGLEISQLERANPSVTAEEIRSLKIGSVAARMATLHLNQFRNIGDTSSMAELLSVDEAGQVRVEKDVLEAIPTDLMVDGPTLPHVKAMKCPALHVPGMLRFAQELIAEVVEGTEQRVQERAATYRFTGEEL